MQAINSVVTDLILPPIGLAFFACLVLLVVRGRAGRRLAVLALVVLVLLSLPLVTVPMLAALDLPPADDAGPAPGAIVILSADTERTLDPDLLDLGPLTLERERAGAALARRTHLPVLVTGGIVNAPPPIAEMMARSMADDFGVPVRWVETQSRTTWENATLSAPILRAAGIGRVYVVTHAWHMRRALLAFQRAGLDAVPAVVRRDPMLRGSLQELVPRTSSWLRAYFALHEWVGLAFYKVRGE